MWKRVAFWRPIAVHYHKQCTCCEGKGTFTTVVFPSKMPNMCSLNIQLRKHIEVQIKIVWFVSLQPVKSNVDFTDFNMNFAKVTVMAGNQHFSMCFCELCWWKMESPANHDVHHSDCLLVCQRGFHGSSAVNMVIESSPRGTNHSSFTVKIAR